MPDMGTFIPIMSRDNCRLLTVRGKLYPECMTKSFREALAQAIEETGTTWSKVAAATGVSYEQLKKLKQGKSQSTNVDDAVKIANHFAMSLEEFIDDRTRYQREEIRDLLLGLEEEERRFLIAAARGVRARDREGT